MQTLLEIGLSNAVVAVALALLAGVSRVARRPALTHSLWLLVLLKLVTPPLVTLPITWPAPVEAAAGEQSQSAGQVEAAPSVNQDVVATLPATMHGPSSLEILASPEPGNRSAVPATPLCTANELDQKQSEASLFFPEPDAAPAVSWAAALSWLWLAGCLLWFFLAAVSIVRFRRLLCHAQPASSSIRSQAEELALRLGLKRCPDIAFVPGAVSPMLWAPGSRPRLLLPSDLFDRLSEEQRATLLAHELAHLRRRDHWVRGLELVVTGLFWWHPVVWWARREIREAEERCCDAWVLWVLPEAARTYADALLETIDFLSRSRPALPQTASGIGQVHLLRRRLTMIMRGTNRRALSAAGLLVVLGLGAVLLPLRPTWAQTGSAPQSDDSRQDQPAAPDPETFQQQINKACQVVEQAKAQVDVQKAQLALAEAALKQAEENLTQSLSRANYVKRKVGLPADQRGQVLKGATTKRAPARRTIKIEVREEKGQPVIRVQDEVVELADLTKILSRYVQKRGEIEFLLDAGNNVNFRTVVAIQDALQATGVRPIFVNVTDIPKHEQAIPADRLGELEKKLDALREELALLRRQAGSAHAPEGYKQAYREYTRAVEAVRQARVFQGHALAVSSVAWSRQGKLALSGSYDTTVRLWDIATGKELRRFKGHDGKVQSVAFSPDGKLVLSGAFDNNVILWDAVTGTEIRRFFHAERHGDERILQSLDPNKTYAGLRGGIRSVTFSPDGRRIFAAGEDRFIVMWDVGTGKEVTCIDVKCPMRSIALSPDGKLVAAGCVDGSVGLWDLASLRPLGSLKGHIGGSVSHVAFSPNGRQIASSGIGDGTIRLWDTESGKLVLLLQGFTGKVECVAFSPDGKLLASAGSDKTIRLWDIATGRELAQSLGHDGPVLSVAFSPDGRWLLSGGEDATLQVWTLSK